MSEKTLEREILSKLLLVENLQTKVAILEQQVTQLKEEVFKKKNKSYKEYRKKVLDFTDVHGSITIKGARQLGLIPKDMTGATFRNCILKKDFISHNQGAGKPAIYYRKRWLY